MFSDNKTILSIIVPVYNIKTHYLDKCISSLINQTQKNMEIIIVDDGSVDICRERIDAYAVLYKNSNIRIVHQHNQGVSAARNNGLLIAEGKYIGFVDADDWVESNTYKRMLELAEDKNLDIIISGFVRDDNTASSLDCERIFNSDEAIMEMFKRKIYVWSVCDKLYKRELLNKSQILFTTKYKMGEDLEFNYKAFKSAETIGYKRIEGYHYQTRDDSATRAKNPDKKLDSVNIMRNMLYQVNEKQKIYLKKLYFKELVSCLFYVVIYGKKHDNNQIINLQNEIKNLKKENSLYNVPIKIKLASVMAYLPIFILNVLRYFRICF